MSRPTSALVLGGGLSGMAAAWSLARAGIPVTLIERGAELGGLAGTFERGSHFYPLGYHHILHHDHTLLYVLDQIGALDRVRWRKIRMFFHLNGRLYDLATPADFARFPMSPLDKLRFVRLMLRSFAKADWQDWSGRAADELIDRWAGPGVRNAIFERLSHLKFRLPCREVSAAWLGSRLYYREGSAPLGYIPGANWTKVLCDGLGAALQASGVTVRRSCPVQAIRVDRDRVSAIELADGHSLSADLIVSTMPTEIYRSMVPGDASPELGSIRYTAMISLVAAARQRIDPEFYWMNMASLDRHACGIFMLDSLNPTIGEPGERCVNFVSHLPGRDDPFFHLSDEEILAAYREDFRAVFGFDLEPHWTHVARVPMYSPVFVRDYRNPPVRSASYANVYFAGNYRTFPSVVSTGTAMSSGFEAAEAIFREHGMPAGQAGTAAGFRVRSQPRG